MITQQEVDADCGTILPCGERPSVENVRIEFRDGFPSSLMLMVQDWKNIQGPHTFKGRLTAGPIKPIILPATIQHALDAWTTTVMKKGSLFSFAVAEIIALRIESAVVR